MTATVTLIPATTFGGSPVGNYDGNAASFSSNVAAGSGYYGSSDGLHTVSYSVANNFTGNIDMQGSLATTPAETDWVNIPETHYGATTANAIVASNFIGNFVWVRANVSAFSHGTVSKVLYNHS